MSWTLRLKNSPALRLDLRAIVPAAFAARSSAEAAQLPVAHGNDTLALAEVFAIERIDDGEDTLVFDVFSPLRQDWIDKTDTYFRK